MEAAAAVFALVQRENANRKYRGRVDDKSRIKRTAGADLSVALSWIRRGVPIRRAGPGAPRKCPPTLNTIGGQIVEGQDAIYTSADTLYARQQILYVNCSGLRWLKVGGTQSAI